VGERRRVDGPTGVRWGDETCPISTEGGTRRVHFVREGGEGGAVGWGEGAPPAAEEQRRRRDPVAPEQGRSTRYGGSGLRGGPAACGATRGGPQAGAAAATATPEDTPRRLRAPVGSASGECVRGRGGQGASIGRLWGPALRALQQGEWRGEE
jgi:hypothetical protein